MGKRDDELYLRWLQLGVFSPIMRLHSTSHDLIAKEPWLYRGDISILAKQYLQLRHHLIPYLFTMDYRCHKDGIALVEPMYYQYPTDKNAYLVPNQYFFGSQLIVAPITQKADKKSGFASCKMWIPSGRYTDIFTKKIYNDSGLINVYRDISSIPILLKAGGILPMTQSNDNNIDNPDSLTLLTSRGNGSFDLYEDNGKTNFDGNNATTKFEVSETDTTLQFTIHAPSGKTSLLPTTRHFTLEIIDILQVKEYSISINGKTVIYTDNNCNAASKKTITNAENNGNGTNQPKNAVNADYSTQHFTLQLPPLKTNETAIVAITNFKTLGNAQPKDAVIEILSRWQKSNSVKKRVYKPIKATVDSKKLGRKLLGNMTLPASIKGAIKEVFKR